jgi:hypothetical protein
VQNGISHHLIWQDFKFWERAIYDVITEELTEQRNYVELDKVNVTRQIVFAKLGSLSHDMLGFDLNRDRIKDLVQIFADNYKLQHTDLQERFVSILQCMMYIGSYR